MRKKSFHNTENPITRRGFINLATVAVLGTACGRGRYERARAITESSSAVIQSNEKTNQIEKNKNDLTEKVTELVNKWVGDPDNITTEVNISSYSDRYAMYSVSLEYIKTDKFGEETYPRTFAFSIEIYPGLPDITDQVEKALKEHQTDLITIKGQVIAR